MLLYAENCGRLYMVHWNNGKMKCQPQGGRVEEKNGNFKTETRM